MKLTTFVSILVLFAFSNITLANGKWSLNNDASTLNFISTKKASIAETNTFKSLSGTINPEGDVNVSIDLSSVDTNIEIRNERMQEHLFETSKFANATVTTKIDPASIKQLKPGDKLTQEVTLKLSLHGETVEIDGKVSAVLLNKNTLLVTSVSPFIVNAEAFGLMKGVNKLKELAGLPSISAAIPVTFQLTFKQ